MSAPLHGLHVLITRPVQQAAAAQQLFAAAGAQVSLLPVLEITALDTAQNRQQLAGIPDTDLLVFISANAVEKGLRLARAVLDAPSFNRYLLRQYPLAHPHDPRPRIAAIGKKTATALNSGQVPVDFQPQHGFTSEDLLALPGACRPHRCRAGKC
ncbi:MAG: uroporphyrinogen-III synthase [Thiolinea sp.]